MIMFGNSCTKEHDMIHIEEEPFIPIVNVEVESLVVSIGEDIPFSCLINNQIYTSEGSGILLIEKLILDKSGSSVLIQSDGYYDEIRYVIPSLNSNMHIEVTLTSIIPNSNITKEIEGFNAKEGGTIDVYRSEISFEPNSLIDATGVTYEGEVNVFATDIFNGAYSFSIRRFPQNSFIEDRRHMTLNIVGGYNLLLRDEMMNPLYLKEGSSANIKFNYNGTPSIPIPDVLKMMTYDVDSDDWISMGSAEKDGEEWKGEIDNFGIITWGVEHESRIAELKLVTEEGVKVPNKFVWLYTDLETPFSMSFSDSDGNIRINVPVGVEFSIRTIERKLPHPVLSKEYSIVGSGIEEFLLLDDIKLPSEYYQVYSGSVIGCNSDVILNSAIIGKGPIDFGVNRHNAYIFSDENGILDFAYPIVNSDQIVMRAYNFDLKHTSQEYFIDNNDDVAIDFGDLKVCE